MPDIVTFAAVRGPGIEDSFSDFYETTFMETSGRSEVDLCGIVLMLLNLAQQKKVLESDVCQAIVSLLEKR